MFWSLTPSIIIHKPPEGDRSEGGGGSGGMRFSDAECACPVSVVPWGPWPSLGGLWFASLPTCLSERSPWSSVVCFPPYPAACPSGALRGLWFAPPPTCLPGCVPARSVVWFPGHLPAPVQP